MSPLATAEVVVVVVEGLLVVVARLAMKLLAMSTVLWIKESLSPQL